jgi:hypothetical protein
MQNVINQVHDETDGQESDADEDHSHRRRYWLKFAHDPQRSFAGPGNAKDKRAPVLAHKRTLCAEMMPVLGFTISVVTQLKCLYLRRSISICSAIMSHSPANSWYSC